MPVESSRFIISPEVTSSVIGEAEVNEDIDLYAKLSLARTKSEHPDLYNYFRLIAHQSENHWRSYVITAAIGYTLMTRALEQRGKQVELSVTEVIYHNRTSSSVFDDKRWKRPAWVLNVANNPQVRFNSGYGFFLNILESRGPEFYTEVLDFINQRQKNPSRKYVVRGFFDSFMPFYKKILQDEESGISV